MKVVSLVGARPQFIKEALVGAEARKCGCWEHVLVHSGQHYDAAMSDVFFQELNIPAPRHCLNIGSGSHAEQTARVMLALEPVLAQECPDALLVYGDTNTTLAGALTAAKMGIPVVHVEAGIRQEPRSMPEEVNRVLVDRLSALLCCCSEGAADNLRVEQQTGEIRVTGDVMHDLFLRVRPTLRPAEACTPYGVCPHEFFVATLHRDFNVDYPRPLEGIVRGLNRLSRESGLPVLLPLHPRTRKNLHSFGLAGSLSGLTLLEPLGYRELMGLVLAARAVLTDSGGLQKEACYADRRAVVIMPDTGWRELVSCGWNVLADPDEASVTRAGLSVLHPHPHPGPLYGEGYAAEAVIQAVKEFLNRAF